MPLRSPLYGRRPVPGARIAEHTAGLHEILWLKKIALPSHPQEMLSHCTSRISSINLPHLKGIPTLSLFTLMPGSMILRSPHLPPQEATTGTCRLFSGSCSRRDRQARFCSTYNHVRTVTTQEEPLCEIVSRFIAMNYGQVGCSELESLMFRGRLFKPYIRVVALGCLGLCSMLSFNHCRGLSRHWFCSVPSARNTVSSVLPLP